MEPSSFLASTRLHSAGAVEYDIAVGTRDHGARADRWLPVVFAVGSAGCSLWAMGPAVGALAIAMLGGLPLYFRTLARGMPEPRRFVAVYLAGLAWQLLHFVEEFATSFHRRLPVLLGADPWSDEQFVAFNLVFYALFLVAAIGMLHGVRPLTYFACFFILAMFLNGVGHVGLAIWVGSYFPGLGTGPLSLVWAVLLVRRLPTVAAGRRASPAAPR